VSAEENRIQKTGLNYHLDC